MILAVELGLRSTVQSLLDAKADGSVEVQLRFGPGLPWGPPSSSRSATTFIVTPLHVAVLGGNDDIVRALLRRENKIWTTTKYVYPSRKVLVEN